MKTKKINATVKVLALMFAILLIACTLVFAPSNVANAISFGGKDSADIWHFGENALDIESAKTTIQGWDLSSVSKPLVIAVIDTGINVNNKVFTNTLLKDESGKVLGYNVHKGAQTVPADLADAPSNHGTSVAGVIAMLIEETSLCDKIKIYPIKANTGNDDSFTVANLTKAVDHAVEMGADVINMSLGITQDKYNAIEKRYLTAFEYSLAKAAETSVVIAAAGNGGSNCLVDAGKFYPAVWDSTVGVMGYGVNGNIYSTSNFGDKYDIAAPGEKIYTAKDLSFEEISGTSMASASVSFAIALLKLRGVAEKNTSYSSVELAKMIRNIDCKTATKNGVEYRTLNVATLLSQDFDNTEYEYASPTAMTLVHNGTLGSGEHAGEIYMRANSGGSVEFVCRIAPTGKVDPKVENSIEWRLQRYENGEPVQDDVVQHGGAKYVFNPTRGGEFVVVATLADYDLTVAQGVFIEYSQYYVGDVRVTFAKDVHKGVDGAPSSGVVYTGEETLFSLTGIESVNPAGVIKWFVNGDYAGSGRVFAFKPKKAGKYSISAQYGDNAKVDFDFMFTAQVKSFVLRPLDLSFLIIGLSAAVCVSVILGVHIAKKKQRINIGFVDSAEYLQDEQTDARRED